MSRKLRGERAHLGVGGSPWRLCVLVVVLASLWPGWAGAGEVVLVAEGNPGAILLLPETAHADEELAAKEIQEHVEKMSGAKLPIVHQAADGSFAPALSRGERETALVRIGASLTPDAEKAIRDFAGRTAPPADPSPSSLLLRVRPSGVALAGLSPEGTLFAAYELLEQLGCRWFMPGEIGTVIPERRTVSLREQETIQIPSFPHRHLQAVAPRLPWYRRMRLGGMVFPSCHGLPIQADFKKQPELYALVGGKRHPSQWCVSNPEVLRRTIEAVKNYFRQNPTSPWIGMGPNDGSGFCECPNCRALDAGDWDPFSNEMSVTDRYIHFFNAVLAEVHKEFPGKKIAFYCYHVYMRPPLREKPDPCITLAFAPITLCRVHGMNNPICPDRSYYRGIMTAWGKLLPEIFERGYYFNLACPGFPFSKVHCVRDEIPFAKKAGITGWRVECMPAWGVDTPTLYVVTKLYWDADRDVDALLDDFYGSFFGPAAKPMKSYFERMDAALKNADHHTGCSFCVPHFYPPDVRKASLKDLKRAEKLAGNTVYGKRVAMFRLVFDALEAFDEMIARRNAFDFVMAKAALDRLRKIQEAAVAHDPPLLNPRAAPSYTQRFWAQAVERGFEHTTGGNELVAALPDRWRFIIDPRRVGEDLGYWRTELSGGNWQTILTSSASWSDQGLHYYKGDAWYRTTVEIPAKFKGRKIMLWFGGVDESAKVWVNGKLVKVLAGDKLLDETPHWPFIPFDCDATEAVLPGEKNAVAVRVTNVVLDEIGTGGITAPVMFWSPGTAVHSQK